MANIVSFADFTRKLQPTVRRYGPRVAASGIAALALTTFAVLPSAAAPDFQAAFKKLDANGDGVITAEEFGGKFGGKGDDVTIETRIIRKGGDGKDLPPKVVSAKPLELKQEAFAFWLPEELTGGSDTAQQQQHEYRFATSSSITIDRKDGDAEPAIPQVKIISSDDLRKKEFENFDTDKDGKVSFREYQDRQKAMLTRGFEMLDANSDKLLSRDEYDRIGTPPMPKIAGLDGNDRQIHVITASPKYSAEKLNAAFEKLDVNKDKKLSLQEYLPPA